MRCPKCREIIPIWDASKSLNTKYQIILKERNFGDLLPIYQEAIRNKSILSNEEKDIAYLFTDSYARGNELIKPLAIKFLNTKRAKTIQHNIAKSIYELAKYLGRTS